MNVDQLSSWPDEAIVEVYGRAASEHGHHSLSGDFTKGNVQADLVAAAYRELRERPTPAPDRHFRAARSEDDHHLTRITG